MDVVSSALSAASVLYDAIRRFQSALDTNSKAAALINVCFLHVCVLKDVESMLQASASVSSSSSALEQALRPVLTEQHASIDKLTLRLRSISDSHLFVKFVRDSASDVEELEQTLHRRIDVLSLALLRLSVQGEEQAVRMMSEMISDSAGRLFWMSNVGVRTQEVSLTLLVQHLIRQQEEFHGPRCRGASTLTRQQLIAVVEKAFATICFDRAPTTSGTRIVTAYHFSTALRRFGPLDSLLFNMCLLCRADIGEAFDWYQPNFDREKAEQWLAHRRTTSQALINPTESATSNAEVPINNYTNTYAQFDSDVAATSEAGASSSAERHPAVTDWLVRFSRSGGEERFVLSYLPVVARSLPDTSNTTLAAKHVLIYNVGRGRLSTTQTPSSSVLDKGSDSSHSHTDSYPNLMSLLRACTACEPFLKCDADTHHDTDEWEKRLVQHIDPLTAEQNVYDDLDDADTAPTKATTNEATINETQQKPTATNSAPPTTAATQPLEPVEAPAVSSAPPVSQDKHAPSRADSSCCVLM